jgi:hypothetical protein
MDVLGFGGGVLDGGNKVDNVHFGSLVVVGGGTVVVRLTHIGRGGGGPCGGEVTSVPLGSSSGFMVVVEDVGGGLKYVELQSGTAAFMMSDAWPLAASGLSMPAATPLLSMDSVCMLPMLGGGRAGGGMCCVFVLLTAIAPMTNTIMFICIFYGFEKFYADGERQLFAGIMHAF